MMKVSFLNKTARASYDSDFVELFHFIFQFTICSRYAYWKPNLITVSNFLTRSDVFVPTGKHTFFYKTIALFIMIILGYLSIVCIYTYNHKFKAIITFFLQIYYSLCWRL